ncbi:hypothetical protein BJ138DRAFT_1103259, partial [Hygrophoropsis aurantiaca]
KDKEKAKEKDKDADTGINPALLLKDRAKQARAASRRRIRGGAPSGSHVGNAESTGSASGASGLGNNVSAGAGNNAAGAREIVDLTGTDEEREEELVLLAAGAGDADLALALQLQLQEDNGGIGIGGGSVGGVGSNFALPADFDPSFDPSYLTNDFDPSYTLLPPASTLIIRAYADGADADADDRVLEDVQPRFVVLFEPSLEFVRRVEVYKNTHPGLAVRVYFMLYATSTEEHRYLAGLRREKEAFERLVRERATMLLPIVEATNQNAPGESLIKTISTRLAGGRKELVAEGAGQVITDLREFRSALPSLIHAAGLRVRPATLTVGDYILTPEICVERKSVPDLIASFNSGRLYTQCELMSVHYKTPVLLIEFEEGRAFGFDTLPDSKQYAKPKPKPSKSNSKYPAKSSTYTPPTLQQKLTLLTLHFPRVRIIWSASPYATADIFRDLKSTGREPEVGWAVGVGVEGGDDDEGMGMGMGREGREGGNRAGDGLNTAPADLLRALPGITAKNAGHVMRQVGSVRALAEMGREDVRGVVGSEPGERLWGFMHRGERGVFRGERGEVGRG